MGVVDVGDGSLRTRKTVLLRTSMSKVKVWGSEAARARREESVCEQVTMSIWWVRKFEGFMISKARMAGSIGYFAYRAALGSQR